MSLNHQNILVLSSIYNLLSNKHIYPEILLGDTIYVLLRFASLGIMSKVYLNSFVGSTIRYLMWVCINDISCSNLRKHISHFSPFLKCFIINVYLEKAVDAKTMKSTFFYMFISLYVWINSILVLNWCLI